MGFVVILLGFFCPCCFRVTFFDPLKALSKALARSTNSIASLACLPWLIYRILVSFSDARHFPSPYASIRTRTDHRLIITPSHTRHTTSMRILQAGSIHQSHIPRCKSEHSFPHLDLYILQRLDRGPNDNLLIQSTRNNPFPIRAETKRSCSRGMRCPF